MKVAGFTGALIAALAIAAIGWVVERLFGKDTSPQARGFIGFLIAAVVIYVSQFIVPNSISVSVLGALIASFVIGLVDAVVPTSLR